MDRGAVWILYKRELRSALRDRGVVVGSILIPILLYPVLIWLAYLGFSFVSGQTALTKSRIALKDLPEAHESLRRQFVRSSNFSILDPRDPDNAIRDDRLDALVEFLPAEGRGEEFAGNFQVRIRFDESRDRSATARDRVDGVVERYRQEFIQQQAEIVGVSREQLQNFVVEPRNVSSGRDMGRFVLASVLPVILTIMLALGGTHPAIDSTAGERENSTWETLLTLGTARHNILIAKYLYVATMSFGAGVLNVVAMTLSATALLGGIAPDLSFRLPIASIPVLAAGAALMALFTAAGMMILASFARTFKEGQAIVTPFFAVLTVPMMLVQGPGREFTMATALIPVANVVLMFRDAMLGTFKWHLIGTTIAMEALTVAVALWFSVEMLKDERLATGRYAGGLRRFLKERFAKR